MPSQYPYRLTIRNEYLGVSKATAMTRNELDWLVEAQHAKWAEQEARLRQAHQKESDRHAARQHAENLKWQADEDQAARQRLDSFRNILAVSLPVNLAVNWDFLLDRREFAPFQFHLPKPDRDAVRLDLLGPSPAEEDVARPIPENGGWWEFIIPFLRARRLKRQEETESEYEVEGLASLRGLRQAAEGLSSPRGRGRGRFQLCRPRLQRGIHAGEYKIRSCAG